MRDFARVCWNEQLEDDLRQIIRLAVREDLDRGCDWTTVALVPSGAQATAHIVARKTGTIAGLQPMLTAIDEMDAKLSAQLVRSDGDAVEAGHRVATLTGSARDLLTCERIVLNLLGRLSGVATLTTQYVEAVRDTPARIYDTRKTTPGWRRLEKWAVGMAGGCNHRTGLFAAMMIKDNHLAFAGQTGISPADAVRQARKYWQQSGEAARWGDMIIEVEVDHEDQLADVLPADPDIVLLDNMSCEQLTRCVAKRNAYAAAHPQRTGPELEASGGVTLQTVAEFARTGVERISVGALTHSAVNFDLGLDWQLPA